MALLKQLMETDYSRLVLGQCSKIVLSGDHVAVADEQGQVSVNRFTPGTDLIQTDHFNIDESAELLDISPSGHYLIFSYSGGSRLIVWSLHQGRVLKEFIASGRGEKRVATSFVNVQGREMLLVSYRTMVLDLFELDSFTQIFSVDYAKPLSFVILHITPVMGDGDTFYMLGYLLSENKNSLYSFSLKKLLAGQGASDSHRMPGQNAVSDYAYSLAAGPCRQTEAVFYRDPEDDEEPEEDGEEPLGEVENFQGIYIRRLDDDGLEERLPYAVSVPTAAPMVATSSAVTMVLPDKLNVLPREGCSLSAESLKGKAFALDRNRARVAVVDETGSSLAIYDIEGK